MTIKTFSNTKLAIDQVLILNQNLQMSTSSETQIIVLDWELLDQANQINIVNKFATFGYAPID